MTFKEKLVKLRKLKKITQDEFASAVGVSRQAVYKWESGQSYPEVPKLIEMKHLFGISIDEAWWGLGIGRALTEACIECARAAGYVQLELGVVADNVRAVSLYKSVGFVEYGRNPKGFLTRDGRYQENLHMRLELSEA